MNFAEAREGFVKFDVAGGVLLRELIDLVRRSSGIGVERERAAVGRRREKAHGRFEPFEAELRELHVFHD